MYNLNHYLPVLFFILVWSCSQSNRDALIEEANSAEIIASESSYRVRTVQATVEPFSYPIQVQGKVVARRSAPLSFQTTGVLDQLYMANAQYVRKGQLLASIYHEDRKLAVRDAEVALARARIEYQNQLAGYGDSLSQGERWQTIQKNIRLLSGLSTAEVTLDRAIYQEELSQIYAPFDGVVEGLKMSEGSLVTSSQSIARLVDQSSLEVEVDIVEFNLGNLSKGDSAVVEVLASPGSYLSGRVREINPKVTEQGFVNVKVAIEETDRLLEGMTVMVSVFLPVSKALVVPRTAIVQKSGKSVVFTEEDGLAKWNYVTLGRENADLVEILEGLSAGARVIVSNNLQLAHDSPVELAN